jgi:hypothetical protein
MPLDSETTVGARNDAILQHDVDECLSLMSDNYQPSGDPPWNTPWRRTIGADSRRVLRGISRLALGATNLYTSGDTVIHETTLSAVPHPGHGICWETSSNRPERPSRPRGLVPSRFLRRRALVSRPADDSTEPRCRRRRWGANDVRIRTSTRTFSRIRTNSLSGPGGIFAGLFFLLYREI